MKRLLKHLFAVTAVVAFALILTFAASAKNETSIPDELLYGRTVIAEMDSTGALLYAYDAIANGIDRAQADITIYDGVHPITVEQMQFVYDAYRRDHAEHFWLGTGYSYYSNSQTVTRVLPQYLMVGDELAAAKAAYEAEVRKVLAGIDESMSEFEKELYIHDLLAEKIVYAESPNAHSSYGALVEGVAVCEGYAEALQYLLQRVGIESFLMIGYGIDPTTGVGEAHEWNAVKLGGKFYQVDLTWNDQGFHTFHTYFNIPDSVMYADHAVTETAYPLPVCNSDEEFYFNKRGNKIEEYSVEVIAGIIKENAGIVHVYLPGGIVNYWNWIVANFNNIATSAGMYGSIGISYRGIGNEYIIIFDNCDHLSLTYVAGGEATCTESGGAAHYRCECGKLFRDSAAASMIYDKNSVIIAPLGHELTSHEGKAATCEEGGWKAYEDCSRCEHTTYEAIGKLGHELTSHEAKAPTYSSVGWGAYEDCSRCDYTTYVELPALVLDPEFKIRSAYLNLTEDINVIYRVTVPAGYDDPYMVFDFNGKSYTVSEFVTDENGRLCYKFEGVNPQCIGDNICATLYAEVGDETVSVCIANYSVRQYCVNQLASTEDRKLEALLSDLLVYGEKAQLYRGYKTEALVTAGLELTPTDFGSLGELTDRYSLSGEADGRVVWKSAGLYLANDLSVSLRVASDCIAELTFRIKIGGREQTVSGSSLESDGEGGYILTFDGVMANELDRTVTFSAELDGETVGQVMTYSVNSYIKNYASDAGALGELVRALSCYGASATEYAKD